jgi:hypothetical protein
MAIAASNKSGHKNNIAVVEPTISKVRLTALSKAVNGTPWKVTGRDSPSVDKPRCPNKEYGRKGELITMLGP